VREERKRKSGEGSSFVEVANVTPKTSEAERGALERGEKRKDER